MLFITLGDPFSVTVEILVKLLPVTPPSFPIVIIGSLHHWQEQGGGRVILISSLACTDLPPAYYFYDIDPNGYVPADKLSAKQRGHLAITALENLRQIKISARYAVLTCPIAKNCCAQAGFSFRGQTEFFSHLFATETIMILSSPQLRVGLVTNHLAIKELPATLSQELVEKKIKLLAKSLRDFFAQSQPRLAVCGFNPHCGDDGVCGNEDTEIVAPAIAACQDDHTMTVAGPVSADTVFHHARQGVWDAVLAIYHDQGLAPLKVCDFYDAVNITGGLPILRISPDHGPASNLYQQDRASPRSFSRCFEIITTYLNRCKK